ncbi:MAG TPA: carbamoyl-phosphate synthase large subunit [Vicinamibacteria bacterium]|nr:carbamoyl-phosphate synthase large subunit [Vicinamibacteria bacterium]
MPKDPTLRSVMVLGSGPIVIGQAAEFDYSGTQAAKVLRQEGVRVVLVNSNPATIMTDLEIADATYIEPLTADHLVPILERERPDALLPTVGGQTGLNLAVELSESGVLERLGVRLIGAKVHSVKLAEDRESFKQAMLAAGLEVAQSGYVGSIDEALELTETLGYPAIIRPSFTLGGTGGGTAYNREELTELVGRGLRLSPVKRVLIEESLLGWKEFELEVMRDAAANFSVVCSIENFDPMGVHTGDSITVAPAQTLTDVEYQKMRNWARKVIDAVGVETGGSNIQFAVEPLTGRMVVIEMNPRVSRSSALASKATGFPIAKIAAKVALGYRLDEIENDITRITPASFEPVIDYVIVKIPRWNFEKFPLADPTLGIQMKSVGEVMAIGRHFREALLKAIRSLELTDEGVGIVRGLPLDDAEIQGRLRVPRPDRLAVLFSALARGWPVPRITALSGVDPWFVEQLSILAQLRRRLGIEELTDELLSEAKREGFSDRQVAAFRGVDESEIRARRNGLAPVFKRVDTCAAEFESFTPYLYSTYESEDEAMPSQRRKLMILGSGPNRIGQGIEFDYCCCQAAFSLREAGIESIMVNCNPETVSTDYDTADRLYFEPLTLEDVLHIVQVEKPEGAILQFGGQTPLKLARALEREGVPILGTSPDSIDIAEERHRFSSLLRELDIKQPEGATVRSLDEALRAAESLRYPILVRPSYVLGGRAMAIVYDDTTLKSYFQEAVEASPEHPVYVDRFLEAAFEVDVDAVSDGTDVVIGGIMEHIEEAGIHSGDSSCVLPTYLVEPRDLETIRSYTRRIARALQVKGLLNVQYAVKDGTVFVLEANPRASRTVPFVSKATGTPLVKAALRVMLGTKLEDLGLPEELEVPHVAVKVPVLPFAKFPGVDTLLGPEMKSTGEVMGISDDFGMAFAKGQIAAGQKLPVEGTVFLSVNDRDKAGVVHLGRRLARLGFRLMATRGTAAELRAAGLAVERVFKVNEARPNVVDHMLSGEIDLVINTPLGRESFYDERALRRTALQLGILSVTTLTGANATVSGIEALKRGGDVARSLQSLHEARKPVRSRLREPIARGGG